MAFIFLALMAGVLSPAPGWAGPAKTARRVPSEDDFVHNYRVSHYLELAVELQTLPSRDRAARLRAMAGDSSRSSDLIPLCRMLFEAKVGGVFRRPLIGGPAFLTGGYQDWPREPIALFEGVPILIVRGYSLAGKAESAAQYVAYCLANCQWTERKYAVVPTARLREMIDRFISSIPALGAHAEWLRSQAV